jgi:hypothetical protein
MVAHDWPQHMVLWLRRLGGKLGLASDLDGPYILLAASVLSLSLRLRCLSLLTTPSPEQEGLVGNQKKGKALTKRCKYAIICVSILDTGLSILGSGAQKSYRFRL